VSLEKERSGAILANIADGIVAVDRDGQVVLWNSAAEEITGVAQEEAIGPDDPAGPAAAARVGGRRETPSGQRLVRSRGAARKSGCHSVRQ